MSTLRGRVFAYMVLAVLVSAALTVTTVSMLEHRQARIVALRTLERQTEALASTVTSTASATPVYATGGVRGLRPLGTARAVMVLAAIPADRDAAGSITVGRLSLLYASRAGPSGRVVVVRPTRLGSGDTRPLAGALILAGLGGALVAAVLSLVLARRLARPLHDLAKATERLSATTEPVPVPVRGPQELAHLTNTFNDMAMDLSRARDAQRGFLLSVGHELKTPLTAIQGYAEGLEDAAVDPREAGAIIAIESARLGRLLRDLLDLARLDRHEFTIERSPVGLAAVAESVLERHAVRAGELGISLTVAGAAPDPVMADPERLLQVVSNLVENALRVTPAGGRIVLGLQAGRLSVSDSGPGIAAEDVPRAFERLYLHQRLTSQRHDGSGLGLALVAQLTEAMGGRATLQSVAGSGATFTIALPEALSAPAPSLT